MLESGVFYRAVASPFLPFSLDTWTGGSLKRSAQAIPSQHDYLCASALECLRRNSDL